MQPALCSVAEARSAVNLTPLWAGGAIVSVDAFVYVVVSDLLARLQVPRQRNESVDGETRLRFARFTALSKRLLRTGLSAATVGSQMERFW